ncbi:MAG: class I SAM-dependent methyltransferase [Bryobacteraceae bacterium]
MSAAETYDSLVHHFRWIFEDWRASGDRQARVIEALLRRECSARPPRLLDCACGIGTQAIPLARLGLSVTGSDVSPGAVSEARRIAADAGVRIALYTADMRALDAVPESGFDAAIAMDNALPHLESDADLLAAASGIAAKLRPGGVVLASIRDYDELVRTRPVSFGPAFYNDGGFRRIVHYVLDWEDERRYTFHIHIVRQTLSGWESVHHAGHYRAVLREELEAIFAAAGFAATRWAMPDESGFYQPILIAKTALP